LRNLFYTSHHPPRQIKRHFDANQIDVINRRNGKGLKHLKLFLLVFAKDEGQVQSPSPRRPSPRKPTPIKESLGAWLDHWEEIAK